MQNLNANNLNICTIIVPKFNFLIYIKLEDSILRFILKVLFTIVKIIFDKQNFGISKEVLLSGTIYIF